MKEVAVPAPLFKLPSKRTSRTANDSTSVTPSLNGSIIDLSSDHETPDTSLDVTPTETGSGNGSSSAEFTFASRKKGKGVSATARAQQLRASSFAMGSSSSRKRNLEVFDVDDDDEESPDARFARKLQAEEYAKADPKRLKTSISNTDEDTEDSIIISDSDDDSDVKPVKSRSKTYKNTSKPGPSSANDKKKAPDRKRSNVIPDSDNESTIWDISELGKDPAEPEELDENDDLWSGDSIDFGSSQASEASGVESDDGNGLANPSGRRRGYVRVPYYENPQRRRVSESFFYLPAITDFR
jgi:hypothetical protein